MWSNAVNCASDTQPIKKAVTNVYHHFFNGDIAAHYVTTPEGVILDCNNSFVHLFGFASRKEALQTNASSLYSNMSERAKFVDLIRKKKRLKGHKAEYVNREGTVICVMENAAGEFDPSGNLIYIMGHLIDESSDQKLQEQLIQSQRLETLGTLVGGIAHDFNNILNVISGHTSLMEKWQSNPERFMKSFEAVKKATERGANTAKQLLTFARKVEVVTESVQIGDIIHELVLFLRETFPERIVFNIEIEPNIPLVRADSNQILQVLLNLCLNARDAMLDAGRISIFAKSVGHEELKRSFREVVTNRYVQVKVSDNGSGMDRETINHIFEPFFTTKRGERGTGLGLSVAYGIMKAHNGFVEVESQIGQGTTFSLFFPVYPQIMETLPMDRDIAEFPKGHGEVILAIEDEELLRDFLKTVLEENGYKVLLASDGLEGLRSYREHMNEVNLVLLDMGLPEMGGAEVLAGLEAFNPHVKVISASGYLEPEVKAVAFDTGALDFLPKPYMIGELLIKIHRVLHRESSV